MTCPGVVLRTRCAGVGQAFDEVVEGQPDAPTVVIERDGKEQCYHQQDVDYKLIVRSHNREREQISENDYGFRCNDGDHDRSHKKSFLAFKDCTAGIAVLLEMKQACKNARATTCGTTERQAPAQRFD